jgi:homocysteine S-methyltransferase
MRRRLWDYYAQYLAIAAQYGTGFVLEAPTWRANLDWGGGLGDDAARLDQLNRLSVQLMQALAAGYESARSPMVVSGCVGPRGDGYSADATMTAEASEAYHGPQIRSFAEAGADMASAFTMTNVPEAVGIAKAAKAAGLPSVISFTLEVDGRLPSGADLEDAIGDVDEATGAAPAYYMVNCAHPTHYEEVLSRPGASLKRLRGLRSNASRRSHAELDASTDLDDGDPDAFGREHRALLRQHPQLTVLGGCCGTDHRHIQAIAQACLAPP